MVAQVTYRQARTWGETAGPVECGWEGGGCGDSALRPSEGVRLKLGSEERINILSYFISDKWVLLGFSSTNGV